MGIGSRWVVGVLCLVLAGCGSDVLSTAATVQDTAPVRAPAASASAATAVPHGQELAARLLRAILSSDEAAIRDLANGREVDTTEMSWLIGDPELRFGADGDRRSAREVLAGGRVLTRIVVTEQADGSTIVEAVFLPDRTARDFGQLSERISADEARNFRDYVMCEFVHADGRTFMRNICFADTDVFDD
jgi:hypothetical protein